jgi:argininosuccinate synthase
MRPNKPVYIEIEFEQGNAVALKGPTTREPGNFRPPR